MYCAVVLDAFSRRVVSWSIDSSQTANLVVNALGMAIENRQAEGVVIHSDHGSTTGNDGTHRSGMLNPIEYEFRHADTTARDQAS